MALEHTDRRLFLDIPNVDAIVLAAACDEILVCAAERRETHEIILRRALETSHEAFVFQVPQMKALRD